MKEQLRQICLYTDDRELRRFTVGASGRLLAFSRLGLTARDGFFQVKELMERGFLPEEEQQSVAFIREMEELGALPASRRAAAARPQG